MCKDLWRRLPKVVRSLCSQRYVPGKQQPEGTGLRSAAKGHSLALCSLLASQAQQPDICDLPRSSFQTCWPRAALDTTRLTQSQASSPLRHVEAATAWPLSSGYCLWLLSCCEQRYLCPFWAKAFYFQKTPQLSPPGQKWAWKPVLRWQKAQYPGFLNDLVEMSPPQAHGGHQQEANSF